MNLRTTALNAYTRQKTLDDTLAAKQMLEDQIKQEQEIRDLFVTIFGQQPDRIDNDRVWCEDIQFLYRPYNYHNDYLWQPHFRVVVCDDCSEIAPTLFCKNNPTDDALHRLGFTLHYPHTCPEPVVFVEVKSGINPIMMIPE